jgi:hypothetical protein
MTSTSDNFPPHGEQAPKRLSEPVANRLLERASEIDARLRAGSTVAELREAANAAGISAEAFEAALAEVQLEGKKVPVMVFEPAAPPQPKFNYRRFFTTISLQLIIVLVPLILYKYNTSKRVRSVSASAASGIEAYQHEIQLRCLSAEEASSIVKPIVMQKGSAASGFRMAMRSSQPGVLRMTASDELLQEIRTALTKAENDPARTCTLEAPAPSSK